MSRLLPVRDTIVIVLPETAPASVLPYLRAVITEFPGDCNLVLQIGQRKLLLGVGITPCDALRRGIRQVLAGPLGQ